MSSENNMLVKPDQAEMEAKIEHMFGHHEALLVKQSKRGWLRECFGCEATSEYRVSGMKREYLQKNTVSHEGMNQPNLMYAIEKSSCCIRLCWRDGRGWEMTVAEGNDHGGQPIVTYVKPCGCPLACRCHMGDEECSFPCCCMLPRLTAQGHGGHELGIESRYMCTFCNIPHLEYSEAGQPVYILHPETCCCGACVACHPCSCKNCGYVPFYFHEPGTGQVVGGNYDGEHTPQIRKVWGGFKKECCTTADTFAVFFPSGINAKRKAGILGLTFLLDFSVFERQKPRE